jgi:hypothetical protein
MPKSGACASAVVAACITVVLFTGASHAADGDLPWTSGGLGAQTASPAEGGGTADGDLPWTR